MICVESPMNKIIVSLSQTLFKAFENCRRMTLETLSRPLSNEVLRTELSWNEQTDL